jgi:NADPH2:quinone reductase
MSAQGPGLIREFGGPEVFEQSELPDPEPAAGEVLVEIRAASVNPIDTGLRSAGGWAGIELPAVLGYDASGVVAAVGPAVSGLKPGDEVFYSPNINGRGSYAQYHVAPEAIVAPKPANLSFQQAASIPLSGCTAWQALIDRAGVKPGERVLIHGAGGVGSLAIQIAVAAGARVAVSCGEHSFELVRGLGADLAIDYRRQDFVKEMSGEPVDVVFDTVGGDLLPRSGALMRQGGRMAGIVPLSGDFGVTYRRNVTVHLVRLTRSSWKLRILKELIEAGKLVPVIDSTLELAHVAEAHRRLEKGKVRGKIVLTV